MQRKPSAPPIRMAMLSRNRASSSTMETLIGTGLDGIFYWRRRGNRNIDSNPRPLSGTAGKQEFRANFFHSVLHIYQTVSRMRVSISGESFPVVGDAEGQQAVINTQ